MGESVLVGDGVLSAFDDVVEVPESVVEVGLDEVVGVAEVVEEVVDELVVEVVVGGLVVVDDVVDVLDVLVVLVDVELVVLVVLELELVDEVVVDDNEELEVGGVELVAWEELDEAAG